MNGLIAVSPQATRSPAVASQPGAGASADLSVVIVNWNSRQYLVACLASLRAHLGDLCYELIVVDSGSFDGTAEMLRQETDVVFVQSMLNIGFARANNLGAQRAASATLLFLNPDTEVTAGSVQAMIHAHRTLPSVGVVGCRLLNSDGTLQRSGVMPFPTVMNQVLDADVLQRLFPRAAWWQSALSFASESSPVVVEALSGACMMIDRRAFFAIGGFSDDYFMYAEDIDLCCKADAVGLLNYYVPSAQIIHHGGGSSRHHRSGFANVMMRESLHLFLTKRGGAIAANSYRYGLCVAAIVRLLSMAALSPVALLTSRHHALASSARKWRAILRWSIGLEGWSCSPRRSPRPRDARLSTVGTTPSTDGLSKDTLQ